MQHLHDHTLETKLEISTYLDPLGNGFYADVKYMDGETIVSFSGETELDAFTQNQSGLRKA